MQDFSFSSSPPVIMHVDINSCFATVEQQANPLLRGKPVVVAAYTTNNGCILAASVEAKRYGIKTGMRIKDAKYLYPRLIVLSPDPDKYRVVNKKLTALLEEYSSHVSVQSIDEMVLSLSETPALFRALERHALVLDAMISIAREIKQRVKEEIGEWVTVSIGIATNKYLAKVASGLQKPDGLRWITKENIISVLENMKLEDLCGIKEGNAKKLRRSNIFSPLSMLYTDSDTLKRGFHSIVGRHWWLRIHGWEDGGMYKAFGAGEGEQKSFGQSYVMSASYTQKDTAVWQILSQLTMKMGKRLREDGFSARGIAVSLMFGDHTHWHNQILQKESLFADRDFYEKAWTILAHAPEKAIRILAVSCYDLDKDLYGQLSLLPEENKKMTITRAIDAIQDRYGKFVLTPARMMHMEHKVMDRIAFGKAGL